MRVYTRAMSGPCLCILLRTAARKTTALYDAALAPLGVNIAQFSLLRRIRRAGPLSLTELARLAELDRSTIGRNTRLLEKQGLVRSATGQDQREALLELTPAGHDLLARGAPLWDQVQEQLEARLGEADHRRLTELLEAL